MATPEERTIRVRRGGFRRGNEFIAVRRIRLTATDHIEPGEPIDKGQFRISHLRSLYERGRIGVRDSAWARMMLAKAARLRELDQERAEQERLVGSPSLPVTFHDEDGVEHSQAALVRRAFSHLGISPEEWNSADQSLRDNHLRSWLERLRWSWSPEPAAPRHLGGGWYEVVRPTGETQRVQGREAAEALLQEETS